MRGDRSPSRRNELMRSVRRYSLPIVIAAYLLLGILYSAAVPLFEAPDERQHYGYVQHLAAEHRLPPQGGETLAEHEASQPPLYYAVAALGTAWRNQRLPLDLEPNRYYGNYQAPGTVNDNKNVFLHAEFEDLPWRDGVLTVHLARFINLLFGGLTVAATYLLAREVFAKDHILAPYAAAFVAFSPQFLFIGSAVNNDIAASALSTLALWLLVGGIRRGYSTIRVVWLGVTVGLAALSKVSTLGLLPLTLSVIGLRAWKAAPERRFPQHLRSVAERWAIVLVAALAVGGWWYLRNGILYRDPFGLQPHFSAWWRYEEPLPLRRLLPQLPGVALTFWGAFGMGNIHLPAPCYGFMACIATLALMGLIVWAIEGWQSGKRLGVRAWSLVVLAVWLLIVFGALLRWMQVVKAALGRLLFPAIGAVAVLVTWGLAQLVSYALELGAVAPPRQPRVRRSLLTGLTVVLLCVAAVAPSLVIRPAYARPALLSEQEIAARAKSVDIQFGDSIGLVGYQLGRRSAHPGEDVRLTVCWEGLAPMAKEYAYFVHFLGRENSVVGSRDTYPGLGRFPTSQWTPGDAFCDVVRVPLEKDTPTQAVYDVEVGWYEPEAGKRMLAYNSAGTRMDLVLLDRIKVVPERPPAVTVPHRVDANLGDRVTLLGYGVSQTEVQAPSALTVTLYWEARTSVNDDYTVFVHLARPDAPPYAQDDGQPRHGTYPTSVWESGEIVVDRHTLQIPEGLPPGDYGLLVGMYRLETRERLMWQGPDGTIRGSYVSLETIVVRSSLP